jgi:hypothetical protein
VIDIMIDSEVGSNLNFKLSGHPGRVTVFKFELEYHGEAPAASGWLRRFTARPAAWSWCARPSRRDCHWQPEASGPAWQCRTGVAGSGPGARPGPGPARRIMMRWPRNLIIMNCDLTLRLISAGPNCQADGEPGRGPAVAGTWNPSPQGRVRIQTSVGGPRAAQARPGRRVNLE